MSSSVNERFQVTLVPDLKLNLVALVLTNPSTSHCRVIPPDMTSQASPLVGFILYDESESKHLRFTPEYVAVKYHDIYRS